MRGYIRRIGPTALIYGGSVGFLFLGEIALAAQVSAEDFAQYQIARNALPLAVAVGLLGIDQALVRSVSLRQGEAPVEGRWMLKPLLLSVTVGALLGAVMHLANGMSAHMILVFALPSGCLGFLFLVAAIAKGSGYPGSAAGFVQGYRLLAGASLVAAVLFVSELSGLTAVYILLVSVLCMAAGALVWYKKLARRWYVTDEDSASLSRVGRAFLVPLTAVALVDWLDQQVVAAFFGMTAAGEYGLIKLAVVFPILSIASVLSFVAMPIAVARMSSLTRDRMMRIYAVSGAACLVVSAIVTVVAYIALSYLFETSSSPLLIVIMGLVGAFRLFYVVPSAIVGARGEIRALVTVGVWGYVGAGVVVLAGVLGSFVESDVLTGLEVVAGALLLATALRAGASVSISLKQGS